MNIGVGTKHSVICESFEILLESFLIFFEKYFYFWSKKGISSMEMEIWYWGEKWNSYNKNANFIICFFTIIEIWKEKEMEIHKIWFLFLEFETKKERQF